jgi:transposase
MVSEDHPVRLFEEILSGEDWRSWENYYVLVAGQPPIHPRVVASVLLYGMAQGIRSSRRLEWACRNAIDFMWLAEGRTIDHSTFCSFRTDFRVPLKGLFQRLVGLAMDMGMVQLGQIALDGTKVKANSSRHATARAKTLQERLEALDKRIEEMMAQAETADQQEDELFEGRSTQKLPRELADVKRRQQRLAEALQKAQAKGDSKAVPVADPQSTVAPNKEGGFAPNYTPAVAVDGQCGIVVATDVLEGSDETTAVLPLVDQVQENTGQMPQQALADSGLNSGPNLQGLADRQVEAFIPSATRVDTADNPARREKLDEPVPSEQWDRLPLDKATKRLGRTAFVYDAGQDCYWCPMGKRLGYEGIKKKWPEKGVVLELRHYACRQCEGCPLKKRCIKASDTARSIDRDAYEPYREAMDLRLYSPRGQAIYRQRAGCVEGTFGTVKSTLGLRQFLVRGLEKVRVEWLWACSALNLKKMVGALAAQRATGGLAGV